MKQKVAKEVVKKKLPKEVIDKKIKEIQDVLRTAEINLRLNEYEDIFSDFDPRPYSEKALSVDFLEEAERASEDKSVGNIKLNLLMPHNKRDKNQEAVIKKRLNGHFKKHFCEFDTKHKKILSKGFSFVVFGVIFMFLAAYVLFNYQGVALIYSFWIMLLEPAGWFLFWEGLHLVIFEPKTIKNKLEFYKKMNGCSINFFSC